MHQSTPDVTNELHSEDRKARVEIVQSNFALPSRHGLDPQHNQSKETYQSSNVEPEIKHHSILFMAGVVPE